jgi:O-antigen/teichoic acid export membrane protein
MAADQSQELPEDSEAVAVPLAPEAIDLLSTSAAGPAAVRGGALRIGSFLAGTLASVGSAALLFRHLGVVDTGHYATAMSLSAVVTGLTDLGLTAIGIREYAVLTGERRARMARNLLGMRLVLTVIGVIVITAFAALAYGRLLALGVLIAGAGVLVQNTQTTLAVPLMASLRLGWVSALDFTRQLMMAGLIVILVLAGAHLLPFLATAGIAAAVVLVPTAMLVRTKLPLRASFERREWRAMLGPVLVYSAAVAAGTLYFRVAIVLVSLIAGGHELGYYSLSFRVVEVLFLLPGLLVGAAFPIFARAARDDPARLAYALGRVFQASLLLGVFVALSLAVGARFAVLVVGGHKFLGAVPILAVQGLGAGASFVAAVWAYGMLSLRLHRLILIFNIAMLALVVTLVGSLTTIDGAQGAAIGTAAAEIVGAVAGGILLARGRPHLRPDLAVLPRVAVAAVLGAAPALASGIPVVIRVVLAMLIYGLALVLLRAIPSELVDLLPARLRGGR